MSVALDNSNPIAWFISFLNMLRVDILDRFEIPGIGVSYWDFIIGCAIASIVITVLINTVRIGSVSYSNSRHESRDRFVSSNDGVSASQMRSHAQGRGGK